MLISAKYASLTNSEYNRLLRIKTDKQANEFQSQIQILSGWVTHRHDVIEFELSEIFF